MMRRWLAAALASAALAGAPAHADGKAELEAVMHEYLKLWNAHDAAGITERFYRLEGANSWGTREGLAAEFERLKAQGYDKSEIQSVIGCLLTPETGQVELRYVRLKTDGGFMPPKDRASIYSLRKFPDGWRVTGMRGIPASSKMDCPSAPAN
ncbi:MAG TPA: hypothetical protein VIA80_17030 [Hyphomonadaceae bacterium]